MKLFAIVLFAMLAIAMAIAIPRGPPDHHHPHGGPPGQHGGHHPHGPPSGTPPQEDKNAQESSSDSTQTTETTETSS